jgi:acetyl/propionyl-CoA carboxylase alpha subunit
MKFNLLYAIWLVLFGISVWLVYRFSSKAAIELFGTAETEGQVLSYEYPILVHQIKVRTGDAVRKGDTLLVASRPDLDKQAVLKASELQQNQAAKQASTEDVRNEIEKLTGEHFAKINSLKTDIELLQAEESAQSDLRKLVSNERNTKSLLVDKIHLLENTVRLEERRFGMQMKQLKTQENAMAVVHDTRMQSVSQEIGFMHDAQTKLILRAPMDGFIENVTVFEKETTSQFKPLLKINPRMPDKVKGFLPEASEALYRMGDTVQLRSSTRPTVTQSGVLVGTAPQLVELPLRLRKIQEVKAWGREVYIKLPPSNDFFIGEKIMITLKNRR